MKLIFRNLMATIAIITVSITSLEAQDYNIYFDFNSDVMRINDVGKLHSILQDFNPDKHTISLIGHTDTVGNYEYNLNLSKRRTHAVKEYLTEKGIASNYISIDYKGKLLPIASDQFYNRRVEIYLSIKKPSKLSFDDFRKSLKPKLQTFTVPSDVDIEIEGNRGTIITIPAKSFVTRTGQEVSGNVEIQLTEFYNSKDFFSEKLSTVSGGNLLTSAGMIELNVFQKNEKLNLKDNSDIELAFPKTNETNYYTFYGERQENGNMNWQSDKRQFSTDSKNGFDDIGVTFGDDGNSLIITDKTTAEKRNSQIQYNPIMQKFGVLTQSEREEVQKYNAEQKKIDEAREKYYNQIKSNRLGFINCDEYIRDPSATSVNYLVQIKNKDVKLVSVALIFRNTNSFLEFNLSSRYSAKLYAKLPLDERPELVVTGIKDGEPYFSHGIVKLTKDKKDEIQLIATTYEKIEEKL